MPEFKPDRACSIAVAAEHEERSVGLLQDLVLGLIEPVGLTDVHGLLLGDELFARLVEMDPADVLDVVELLLVHVNDDLRHDLFLDPDEDDAFRDELVRELELLELVDGDSFV